MFLAFRCSDHHRCFPQACDIIYKYITCLHLLQLLGAARAVPANNASSFCCTSMLSVFYDCCVP